jgi:hypothetical protein
MDPASLLSRLEAFQENSFTPELFDMISLSVEKFT